MCFGRYGSQSWGRSQSWRGWVEGEGDHPFHEHIQEDDDDIIYDAKYDEEEEDWHYNKDDLLDVE